MSVDRIEFKGVVTDGLGRYGKLAFPRKADMLDVIPSDWPDNMFRGSLNITIDRDGFPPELNDMGEGRGITRLDNRHFKPAFSIPQDMIGNNTIGPRSGQPDRGIAQVWRAAVQVEKNGACIPVWAARRIGSAYTDVMEVMSEHKLRDRFGLVTGDKVTATLYANDNPAAVLAERLPQAEAPAKRRILAFLGR